MARAMSRRISGSSPADGSSRSTRVGRPSQGDRDEQPPLLPAGEVLHARAPQLGVEPRSTAKLCERERVVVEGCEESQRLVDGQAWEDARRRLRLHADVLGDGGSLSLGIHTEHRNASRTRPLEPGDEIHRCRLARTVGAEEADDLHPPWLRGQHRAGSVPRREQARVTPWRAMTEVISFL